MKRRQPDLQGMLSMLQRQRPTTAAAGILIATVAFVGIVGWLHLARPDIDPINHGVSRYAGGEYGHAVSVAFGILSLALLLAAWTINSEVEATRISGLRQPFSMAAAGLVLVVLFPLRSPSPALVESVFHQVGGGVFFVAAIVGIHGVSARLRSTAAPVPLQSIARLARSVGDVGLILFFASIAAKELGLNSPLGAFQRICLAAICAALVTVALALSRRERRE